MFRLRVVSVVIVCIALLCLGYGGPLHRVEAAPAAPVKEGRHALLVGCTEYPNLDKKFWLNGPGNDVQLMAKALREMFGFAPETIVILSDEVAKAKKDDKLLPTKANIQREFEELAKRSKAGDKVVVMLGGHGSQQPEAENTPNPKPDGLNEIFLPRDVGPWDDGVGKVTNAVVDNELNAWLQKIQDTKASIWITVDACHSGTITRDLPAGGEKAREIDKTKGLGITEEALKKAAERALKRDGPTRGGPVEKPNAFAELSKKPGGLVAIYAAKPTEVTLERDMPMKSKDAKPYGLLTYTLVQTLEQAQAKGSKPLTYRELVQRIQAQYFAWGRTFPTPLIEGVDTDREVLGEKEWPGRSSVVLAKGDNGLKVTAGALRGLTTGSILAVTPPPGQGDKPLGHVKITEVRTIDADVEPFAYDNVPQAPKLPLGGACKVVFVDAGDQQLKLTLEPKWKDNDKEKVLEAKDQERLLKMLGQLAEPKEPKNPDQPKTQPLVRLVKTVSEADWVVRPHKDGKQLVLVPAEDMVNAKVERPRLFGPYPDDDKLLEALEESAQKIFRFENLRKLAAGFAEESGDQGVKFKVEMRRGTSKTDRNGTFPLTWPSTELAFHDGDWVVYRFTNTGRIPIDLTILYLDSDYNISCAYPQRNEFNRIGPGETLKLKPIQWSTKTKTMEYFVLIAVKGQDQTVDFACLEQKGLEKTKAVGKSKSLESPLGGLFQKAMYNAGSSRGMKMAEVDDHAMQLLSWQIKPEKRPADKK